MSCHRWSRKTSLPKPSTKIFLAIDGPRTKYGCCKWSPFATDGPHTTAIQMMILMAIVVEEPSEALYLRHVKGKISWSSYSYYFIHLQYNFCRSDNFTTAVALLHWFIADRQWSIPFPTYACRYLVYYSYTMQCHLI